MANRTPREARSGSRNVIGHSKRESERGRVGEEGEEGREREGEKGGERRSRPVEVDLLGLDLAVLDVDLISAQDDGDRLANPDNVPMPVGHVLVCHACSHVEHDDRTVALNVVACNTHPRQQAPFQPR